MTNDVTTINDIAITIRHMPVKNVNERQTLLLECCNVTVMMPIAGHHRLLTVYKKWRPFYSQFNILIIAHIRYTHYKNDPTRRHCQTNRCQDNLTVKRACISLHSHLLLYKVTIM